MKKGVVICGPDVASGPLALLTGTFQEKASKAAELGFDGIELMVRDPAGLDWEATKETLDTSGLEVPQVVTGELYGSDGLCLVTADEDLRRRSEERVHAVIDLAAFLGAMVNIGRLRGQLQFLGEVVDAWRIAVARLRDVAEYAADRSVKLTIEPLNRYETDFIFNSGDGQRLLQDIGCDNVGLMMDLFHMNIEDASIEDGLRLAGDTLWHVHVADSNRRYPGSGHLGFRQHLLRSEGYGVPGLRFSRAAPAPRPGHSRTAHYRIPQRKTLTGKLYRHISLYSIDIESLAEYILSLCAKSAVVRARPYTALQNKNPANIIHVHKDD